MNSIFSNEYSRMTLPNWNQNVLPDLSDYPREEFDPRVPPEIPKFFRDLAKLTHIRDCRCKSRPPRLNGRKKSDSGDRGDDPDRAVL